jgi:hypothetical protein
MTKEDQETSGSLRSGHGRESSWVVEFSVTKWSRNHRRSGSLRSSHGRESNFLPANS